MKAKQLVGAFLVGLLSWLDQRLFKYMASNGLLLTAVQLPNGSIVEIAASYGDVIEMSALSNADPAIATLAASHGVAEGDFMEVTSGWSRLTNKIVRAGAVVSNDIEFDGIDTTSTVVYPAGSGIGSIREILSWTQIQQILESGTDGGEQQFLNYQFLEDDSQKRIPTVKNPSGMTFSVADDPSLAGFILASEANDDRLPRGIRITLPSGAIILYKAYVTLNKIPSLTVNELMAVEVTLSLLAEPVRYAAAP